MVCIVCKKLIYLTSLVLLLGLAGSVSAADINWTDGDPAGSLWNVADNWGGTEPGVDDRGIINYIPGKNGPTIQSGINVDVKQVQLGTNAASGGVGLLTMTGGTLTLHEPFIIGHNKAAKGALNISDGTITTSPGAMWVSRGGIGTLNMTGGLIELTGDVYLGQADFSECDAQIRLDGGTIKASDLLRGNNATVLMDVTAGTMILNGNKKAQVEGYVDAGWLTAYDGDGAVEVDYDITNSGKTTIKGTVYNPYAKLPDPCNGTEEISTYASLGWLPGDFAVSHDIYFGTNESAVANAVRLAGDVDGSGRVGLSDVSVLSGQWLKVPPSGSKPSSDLNDDGDVDFADFAIVAANWMQQSDGIFKGHHSLDANSYEPGIMDSNTTYFWRVDEVNDTETWQGSLWSFKTTPRDESLAWDPNPPAGHPGYAVGEAQLSWSPGVDTNSHDVYFGTSFNDVNDANTTITKGVYRGRRPFDSNSYDPPGNMSAATTYYWRIDEVNEAACTICKGQVWSFAIFNTIASGSISTNTTWQGGVLVEDSVIVQSGITLTVLPGTSVLFKHYRGYKEPEKRLRLHVIGTLSAVGTAQEPIYFSSDAPEPHNGDWCMIRLDNSTNSVFDYCVVECGQQGINAWDLSSPDISHCVVRWNNWEGLYFESYATSTIEYCHIIENGYNGLAAEQFNNITMDHCEIERSGTNGFHIDATEAEIRRSLVHDNHASGLSVNNNGTIRALGVASNDNDTWGIGVGGGNNTVEVGNVTFSGNKHGEIQGDYTVVETEYTPPSSIDVGFTPDMSYELGYMPSDPDLDKYMYVYPDDETRKIVRKIGAGLGLTWSLAWDGQYIWTVGWGTVSRLDPVTGEVLQQFAAPGPGSWGMTYDGEYLWVVDFAEKRISKVDPATGNELATYPTPDPVGGCKGITWDGSYLYVMGWTSPKIYKMDRQGNHLGTITLDSQAGGGLTWDGQHFWAPGGEGISKFDSQGHKVGWIYPASEGTWDMTWDGQYLWASQRTNENWQDDKIFALEILDDHDN